MFHRKNEKSSWESQTIVCILILILLRIILSNRLPSYIMSDMPHDDGWLVKHAMLILNGEWLGQYDQYTLIKGVFSPILLAFSSYIGITFRGINTALYCFSCVVFLIAIRPLIKRQLIQVICFTALLFNPITFALETGQRIYRNAIGQWEILLVFGCLIAVYIRRMNNWKELLKWELVGGLALGAFFQTREDGIWIVPFTLCVIIITIITYLLEKEKPPVKMLLFLTPLVIVMFLNNATAFVNYKKYGAAIINDRSGGNYAKVAADLQAITPEVSDEMLYKSEKYKNIFFNVYVSTMDNAISVSPTLNSAAKSIRAAIRGWLSWGDPLKSGQLSTDHMLFALRDGVRGAGYYQSLPETEAFYGKVHNELQSAFKSGLLKKRGFCISPLIPPFQKGDLIKTLSLMPGAIMDIVKYSGVSCETKPAAGYELGIQEFNLIAGGDYYTTPSRLIFRGWALAKDDNTHLLASLHDRYGTLVCKLPFQSSEDVYIATEGKFKNAKSCRLVFAIDGYNLNSGLFLRFSDINGKVLKDLAADGSINGIENNSIIVSFENLKDISPEKKYSTFVGRAKFVISIYKRITPFISLLACLVYIAATIVLIREIVLKKILKTLTIWLIMTGMAATFILFVFSMCLIEATSFKALHYLYTAPAYIILLMFLVVSHGWAVDTFLEFKKRRLR